MILLTLKQLILWCMSHINSACASASLGEDYLPCINSTHAFVIVYTQNINALTPFARDRD